MTEPSVENLRKASIAIYIAVEKVVADDVSNLLRWAADEIERLRRTSGESQEATSSSVGHMQVPPEGK